MHVLLYAFVIGVVLSSFFNSTNPVIQFFSSVVILWICLKALLWVFSEMPGFFVFLFAFSLIGAVFYCVMHDWKLPPRG